MAGRVYLEVEVLEAILLAFHPELLGGCSLFYWEFQVCLQLALQVALGESVQEHCHTLS